jgi:hypothetical protein
MVNVSNNAKISYILHLPVCRILLVTEHKLRRAKLVKIINYGCISVSAMKKISRAFPVYTLSFGNFIYFCTNIGIKNSYAK